MTPMFPKTPHTRQKLLSTINVIRWVPVSGITSDFVVFVISMRFIILSNWWLETRKSSVLYPNSYMFGNNCQHFALSWLKIHSIWHEQWCKTMMLNNIYRETAFEVFSLIVISILTKVIIKSSGYWLVNGPQMVTR